MNSLKTSIRLIHPVTNRHLPDQNTDRNTRTKCEICSKLTINTLIVNFEDISHIEGSISKIERLL